MLQSLDNVLNRVTMYRLTVYVLAGLIAAAMLLGWLGMIAVSPWLLLFSLAYITAICIIVNAVFARMFDAHPNVESLYITALILALILSPPKVFLDGAFLELAGWAAVWAMASKYMFAIRRKHLFNPAAFGVAVTALFLGASASWWVATLPLVPFVLIGGLILTRKIQRFDLVLSFLIVATLVSVRWGVGTFFPDLWRTSIDVPLFFFAFVMLTEPLTTPPTRPRRIAYGALTGLLFAPWAHIGSLYFTPELALLAGNIFSYLVSPKAKLLLTLRKKIQVSADTYDFWFTPDRPLAFKPGQYLEWTLPHDKPDNRGNRRYFTISSSPQERGIAMGVKFHENGSSYKKKLLALRPGDTMSAGQLSGDFTLPGNPETKLAFIAGGIGVTPFRSMIRSLIDRNERRPVVLFYANRKPEDIAYRDVFDEAQKKLGIKTVYTLTDSQSVPRGWDGYTGYISEQMIRSELPDYRERHFYLSGPRSMIVAFEKLLQTMGVHKSRITMDFFPGFA